MICAKYLAQSLAYSKCSIMGDIADCVVMPGEGGGFSMESEDRARPHECKGSFCSVGGQPLGPGLPGHHGPRAGAKSRVCSSLIAAQVGRLVELGAASGRATRPG